MKQEILVIEGAISPVVEMDSEAGAAYIRFRKAKVAKTISRFSKGGVLAIDLGRDDQVVGIEIIGVSEVQISKVLKQAKVEAPRINYANTRFVNRTASAALVPA